MHSALLIKPKHSIFLFLFFCFLYLLSFALFVLVPIPLWLHFAACLSLLFHFIYVIRRHVFYRHPLSVKRLWRDERDHWKIQCRDAHVRSVRLLQSIIVSRYLVFLTFRVPGRFFPLPVSLALDSDHPDVMRCLRRLIMHSQKDAP